MVTCRDLTPPEIRSSRYHWLVDGELDNKVAIIVEDGRYWRVLQLMTGEALMTALDTKFSATKWAVAAGYRVLNQL